MLVGGETAVDNVDNAAVAGVLIFFREFTFDSLLLFSLCCAIFLLSNSRSVASALEDCLYIYTWLREIVD
ncbi:hypothetical protein GHT06_007609 [Daphnia sinensis]|uniref:Uncharacterized protein n=1 Tax=Daphnia sinensis TaxID=1820382 RepID=A0AAD5PMF8_9CRUS|nr:hypothetical protein GHT06_005232 [Daphnia sinensis]KAI9550019.1 hypothetical protein GHT06_007609 [Daphnia sinensis]